MTISFAVNGVSLDDPGLGWRVLKGTQIAAPVVVRGSDITVPGFDGVMPSANDPLDAPALGLRVEVKGGSDGSLDDRLAALYGLFGGMTRSQRQITKTVDGTSKTADAKLVSVTEPSGFSPSRHSAIVQAVFKLTSVYWRGPSADFSRSNPVMGTAYEVTTLSGSTGPIADSLILVTGPVVNPRVTDTASGEWVLVSTTVAGGDKLLVDCANWVVRKGAGTTFTGGGTVISGSLTYTKDTPQLFSLTGAMQSGDPTNVLVKASLSGTGNNSNTVLAVRARPSYLS